MHIYTSQVMLPALNTEDPADIFETIPAATTGQIAKKEINDVYSSLCVICLDAPVEGALIPCGHMAGCMSCLKLDLVDWMESFLLGLSKLCWVGGWRCELLEFAVRHWSLGFEGVVL
ncbi:ankyrin repeat-containing protein [Tanacetum coccineum]|uniref:Ankyrin repeat-containing protein n=1 Tax=Tanacetum coccineum TaxID=301880 RepID=A0ABQ4Y5U2_9ASTR